MRTTHQDATVRLYYLDRDSEGGAAEETFSAVHWAVTARY